jgi:hypothetical protein
VCVRACVARVPGPVLYLGTIFYLTTVSSHFLSACLTSTPSRTSMRNEQCSWFQTFAMLWLLYAFFRVIPRHLNFICPRLGTLRLFHLHRRIGSCPPVKTEQSILKRRHIKFRCRGITQKKAYNNEQCVCRVILVCVCVCEGERQMSTFAEPF